MLSFYFFFLLPPQLAYSYFSILNSSKNFPSWCVIFFCLTKGIDEIRFFYYEFIFKNKKADGIDFASGLKKNWLILIKKSKKLLFHCETDIIPALYSFQIKVVTFMLRKRLTQPIQIEVVEPYLNGFRLKSSSVFIFSIVPWKGVVIFILFLDPILTKHHSAAKWKSFTRPISPHCVSNNIGTV